MGWRKARFKGKDVFVACDAGGVLAVQGGRVAMRYSDGEGAKLYGAGAANLTEVSGPVLDLPEGVSADAAPKAKASKGSGFGSAGSRTKAQAEAAAEAAGHLIARLPEGTAIAFTDGSCKGNPGPAGSGASIRLPDGRHAQSALSLGKATNNVAELTAVQLALDLLDEAGLPPKAPVALLTDSKYSHGVLSLGWKAKANAELIVEIRRRLKLRPGVALHWVAGHVGIDGNEDADALANEGVAGRTFTRWT